jgi:hypothetical protein
MISVFFFRIPGFSQISGTIFPRELWQSGDTSYQTLFFGLTFGR